MNVHGKANLAPFGAAAKGGIAPMARIGRSCTYAAAIVSVGHSPVLWRLTVRKLGDNCEAQDVAQEGSARRSRQTARWLSFTAKRTGWRFRIAVNICFETDRRLRVISPGAELPESEGKSPLTSGPIAAHGARREAFRAADRYRGTRVLCYREDVAHAAAAQVVELSLEAMESLLFRVRRGMRDLLEVRAPFAAQERAA